MARLGHLHVDGRTTGLRIRVADNWAARAIGLLATPALDDPCGLWLAPCSSIHMFGMRYEIDVAFVRRDGIIARLVAPLRPWRISACRNSHAVLELRAGLARRLHLSVGRHVGLQLC